MKIKSNASLAEISSPFYKINEDFCSEFENYIASKNGKVKGNYNAWSYFIEGKIINPKPWHLKYKKATYSSTGNLLLSSKSQSLLTMAEWSSNWVASQSSEFEIRRKDSISLIKRYLNKNLKNFKWAKEYVIFGGENNASLIDTLGTILEPLLNSRELYSIALKNNTLTISLRTERHHFEIFEKILLL